MHASSFENMVKCYRRYVSGNAAFQGRTLRVLDIGGADVNGSYSEIFSGPDFEYVGADLKAGPGVSLVLDDPYKVPSADASFDFVLSGQMLEHSEYFWLAFQEMVRVVKPDGFIFLIAPSAGPIHRYPVDCYRFYPDAYKALASYSGCHLVESWHDTRGPWNDLVGIFSKTAQPPRRANGPDLSAVAPINKFQAVEVAGLDLVQGERPYLEVLERLHQTLRPINYLEIGVRHGRSLALAEILAVGVDPDPDIKVEFKAHVRVVRQESDAFFEGTDQILKEQPELVFIDGMHRFENVLRDFMNVEAISGDRTVVVIDDVSPNLPEQATRERKTRVWTGDVWKIISCLKKYRPDLHLTLVDASPTGLLIISGLDRNNRVLWNQYNPIVRAYAGNQSPPPVEILKRVGAISPLGAEFENILATWRKAKIEQRSFRGLKFDPGAASAFPRSGNLRLSVIVASYNMARELPRTLRSLAPPMQQGISPSDYEIIVVDNGSSKPFDRDACNAAFPNIRFVYEPPGDPSPVKALNRAIDLARGDLVGMFIDGARMASPGMLARALEASRMSPMPVIGTIAFHLGFEVQSVAVTKGYNQDVEDRLLGSVQWQDDGYKLFEIAAFAGSSSKGWFTLPAETNGLFMKKALWKTLGGFNEGFRCAGGGLANLELWMRACHHPGVEVFQLLGEATFHQFHGGVATNSATSRWKEFDAEHERICGKKYAFKPVPFSVIGELTRVHGKSVKASLPAGV